MSAISVLNPKAEHVKTRQAMDINISAARGLMEVMKTNLGPKGTLKMLVSGAGDIKITKDGYVLLNEMQIQHPTAGLLARCATAQDDETGDGTTSTILYIAEILKQADQYLSEGLHPRLIVDGLEAAKNKAVEVLNSLAIPWDYEDRDTLVNLARTSLRTKLSRDMADQLTENIVNAVLAVYDRTSDEALDLKRVEIMDMKHKTDMDTKLVKGLVLDHGGRHPDMPKTVDNAFLLVCNVSLEYEKTEVNSSFFYKSAEDREKLLLAEREFIDARVQKIIELKKKVCADPANIDAKGRAPTFVLIDQKGIDPLSLDALARENIMALRRAKRRNMERLALACGGYAVNAVEHLNVDCLGRAGLVYEYQLGEEKYTFVEDCQDPRSVTLLVRGPNKYTITQIKDAIKDGMRAVQNTIVDGKVIPGGGAFEIRANRVIQESRDLIEGKALLGVQSFADALLVIPKVLAQNSGHDAQEVLVKLRMQELKIASKSASAAFGVDVATGQPMVSVDSGVLDNYCVKRQIIYSSVEIASQLLLVDEIMRAGLTSLKG